MSDIKGIFIEEKDGQYGPYLSIGISSEGLKALNSLPKSQSGYINLTAGRQKANNAKFSVKPYVPKGGQQQPKNEPEKGKDDLPF